MTRLSHTQKEKYEQCGYKYYLYYIEKYRSTIERSALCFGNALDAALNNLLLNEGDCHKTFDEEWLKYKDKTIDYYKSDLDTRLLTPDELKLKPEEQTYLSLQRKGHRLLNAYKDNILPRIKQVISIQDEVTIMGYDDNGNETGDSIYGKIDLIAMIEDDNAKIHHAILDNKTTSEAYAKNSVQTKPQLALYSVAYPDIPSLGYLTMNKKTFATQIIIDTVTEERKLEVLQGFVDVLDSIKAGVFEKNTKSCYAFGKRCEYWTHCHKGYFSSDIYKIVNEETKE